MSAFKSSLLSQITGLDQQQQQREKKNFLKENVKNLRNMQKKMEESKTKKATVNLADPKVKRGFTSVQLRRVGGVKKANVYLASSSESSSSSSASSAASSSSTVSSVPTPPTAVGSAMKSHGSRAADKSTSAAPPAKVKTVKESKDQCIQTIDLRQSKVDSEGVIRYPTNFCGGGGGESCSVSPQRGGGRQRHSQRGEGEAPLHPSDNQPDSQQPKGQPIDYVKMNATIQYKEKSPAKEKKDPTRPPPNYQKGVVPKYLHGIKKTSNKSEDTNGAGAGENLPPGHILLSDSDRLEHLRLIRQSYADLVQQLNNLPVRSDTLRARTRKAEIEKELDRLERGIKLFSRDKLYVRVAP